MAARMPLHRRQLLALLGSLAALGPAGAQAAEPPPGVQRGRRLQFPRDHGAHPEVRTEWWYLTGALWPAGADLLTAPPRWGFQVTFFRSATGLAAALPGRLAPRQILFAHAALTELATPGRPARHLHDQRLARWNGDPAVPGDRASLDQTGLRLGAWLLTGLMDGVAGYSTRIPARGFELALSLARTQPILLQGEQGWSQKGPLPQQASHYLSEPQLRAGGTVRTEAGEMSVQGRAWLDHEWSDELLPPEAEGWDWLGINLDDGSALTAFRLRAKGEGAAPVWAGGSWRAGPDAPVRAFAPGEVRFTPLRWWTSPLTGARYPVAWRLQTPAGEHRLQALFDAQELDSRASTGTVYWEGLSELLDASGRRVGLGYLEMTGYSGRLRL